MLDELTDFVVMFGRPKEGVPSQNNLSGLLGFIDTAPICVAPPPGADLVMRTFFLGAPMVRGVRVYLLAASRLVQDALTRLISRKGDLQVVATGACSPEIIDSLLTTEHDVLLADWASSGPELLGMLYAIRARSQQHKSVLLGMKDDQESFLRAVKAGAKGILLDDASAADVTTAIRAVAAGGAVCPPSFCAYLFDAFARQASLPNAKLKSQLGLTRREQQLLPLIARGLTNKEIASTLCLSEQTIKNHIHRMLQKTGTTGRLEVLEACDDVVPAWPVAHVRT